jgi:hypothetical protein
MIFARDLPETAQHATSRRPTSRSSAPPFNCSVAWVGEVVDGDVNHPSINGMQGVRGSNPLSSTTIYQRKRPDQLPQQPGQPQQNPNPAGSQVRQAFRQAIRERRHLAGDLRCAIPAAGHVPEPLPASSTTGPLDRRYGPRAGYPVAGAWAARACGIAVVRIGRPAPLFTLVAAWVRLGWRLVEPEEERVDGDGVAVSTA